MANYLKLKVNDEPTIFNKEMAIGTLLLPVPIVGTLVGGYVGKARMESEKAEGRLVSDNPSMVNKDTLLGALVGSVAGAVVGLAVAAATFVVMPPLAPLAYYATSAAGMVLGGAVGGKMGQSRQKAEFNLAKQQVVEREMSRVSRSIGEPERELSQNHAATIERERAHTHEHHR